ncbi:hypothetical protein [Streptomyces aidingensis]|uniref:Uncharacterized protein n=1 Tax=Streptomyces aidingensis TaxID=910347 RepID=A0A1I1UTF5_9ACTN|nr:hypothetical protein [Streptomyces aidingensis]SFD73974.1 hypothetical protein SAMN05421773_1273 [Streptomyces aidingensis]
MRSMRARVIALAAAAMMVLPASLTMGVPAAHASVERVFECTLLTGLDPNDIRRVNRLFVHELGGPIGGTDCYRVGSPVQLEMTIYEEFIIRSLTDKKRSYRCTYLPNDYLHETGFVAKSIFKGGTVVGYYCRWYVL